MGQRLLLQNSFVQDIDRAGPMNYDAFIAGLGAIVLGRTTYEWLRDPMPVI
jgi:hypothetical protein